MMVLMVGMLIKMEKIRRNSLEKLIPQTIRKIKAMQLILRFLLATPKNNKMLLVEVFNLR